MNFYYGVVENREDPLLLGRCQVRVVGLHTENKKQLPTEDLPWAHAVLPVTSAGMNGIGQTAIGPVEGTTVIIIFADDDKQQPIMIGAFSGLPQSKAAADAESSGSVATGGGILTDSSGSPVTDGSGNNIQVGTTEANPRVTVPVTAPSPETPTPNINEQPVPNTPPEDILKKAIPTAPPPGSTSKSAVSEKNIKLIIEACDKVGLKSKYAKCAILGICGGESAWQPLEEGFYYSSAETLARIFRLTFPTIESAEPYAKWSGSREEFFKKIYSPDGNGKLVGHKGVDDGAKYFGRGFNQITGKALYTKLQEFLSTKGITVDFVNNPKSLIEDSSVAALATVAFYSLFVKHNQDDPGYFQAALRRTGADANGTGYAKKQKYYEYFLGAPVTVDPTNKPSADAQKTYDPQEVQEAIASGKITASEGAALLENRSDADDTGFRDPKKKYPLRNLMDEPDLNRLARGVIKGTAIEFKDSIRTKQIPIANNDDTWEQPLAPFGGKYPYSKVTETESGHLFIMDDTPSNENISLYHRQGTFLDIDANGTQVNKIVGDGYTIVDKNGSIFIGGRCILTVGNGVNILVQGDADIEVEGHSVVNLKNQADISVANDLNLSVGGDMKIKVAGNYLLEAAKIGIQQPTGLSIIQSGNSRPNQFGYLSTPVRPSPPVSKGNPIIEAENEAVAANYVKNPTQYYNPDAEKNGVKANLPPTPKDTGAGQSLKAPTPAGDIPVFLQKQLDLTAQSGHWKETGMGGNASNQNILRIWSDLGFPNQSYWKSDQTPWCMGFVAWTLKQCGYRYYQTASARAIRESTSKFGATQVDIASAQPGDIVLWDFSHVNFVYTAQNGKLSFVGGNQGGKAKDNNPNSGDCTVSWPSGWTSSKGGIVGIWRPSKT
jgi:predicted chitinase